MFSGDGFDCFAFAALCSCSRFSQISLFSQGVCFLTLGFNGMVSKAVSLMAVQSCCTLCQHFLFGFCLEEQ